MKPTFSWVYPLDVPAFTWSLADEGENILAREEVAATSLELPSDAPSLEPGRTYLWCVEVPTAIGKPRRSAWMGVKILEPGLRDMVAAALAAAGPPGTLERDLARASVLIDLKLWYDAISALDSAIGRYPREVRLYELRAAIFSQLAWTRPLAERDFARADQLIAARSTQ